jgi:hypothetical protein
MPSLRYGLSLLTVVGYLQPFVRCGALSVRSRNFDELRSVTSARNLRTRRLKRIRCDFES